MQGILQLHFQFKKVSGQAAPWWNKFDADMVADLLQKVAAELFIHERHGLIPS
jgi:hypothetical protein